MGVEAIIVFHTHSIKNLYDLITCHKNPLVKTMSSCRLLQISCNKFIASDLNLQAKIEDIVIIFRFLQTVHSRTITLLAASDVVSYLIDRVALSVNKVHPKS